MGAVVADPARSSGTSSGGRARDRGRLLGVTFAPGVVLGGMVRLERPLAAGAMGQVWVATHLRLQTEVAVKVMRGHGTAEERARFEREARAVAGMGSPFTAQVLDFGVTDAGAPFAVMELLRGQDLKSRLAGAGGPLSLAETAQVVKQTCRALSRAHEMGIVHRDVKPANVFIVDAQGTSHIKLLDFGVAKLVDPQAMHMTSTGAVIGTPYYMSPEQLFHSGSVDHRADLWAVAVIAYACLTGRLPFQGETVAALSVAMHRGAFVPLRDLRPDLPPAVDAWTSRALAPNIDQRFGSATELAEAFQRAAASGGSAEISTASPVGPIPRDTLREPWPSPAIAKPARPNGGGRKPETWMLGGLVALAVLALSGLGAHAILGSEANEARARDDTGEDGREDARPTKSGSDAALPVATQAGTPTARPTATASTPAPATATAQAEATSGPTSGPQTAQSKPPPPVWRKRGMRCVAYATSKSCHPCCMSGDRLQPYPSCECMFDGEKWDRERGKAR